MKILQKLSILSVIFFAAFMLNGCGIVSSAVENISSLAGLDEKGTVISQRAQIRSSYAVVAADLLEVKRGETLNILEEFEFENVRWFRVRARDEDQTEGWIEAQNVIVDSVLDKSKELAEKAKDQQPQATGQLRAASNLRLTPDIQNDENILLQLENGATFEITDWKFVPKAQEPDNDTADNKNSEVEAAKSDKKKDEPAKLDETYDIWYQVRLDPSQSPAPAGWLFGRQVELQVPNDIVYYQQNNRKFVTWQRLDNVETDDKPNVSTNVPVSKPGSWVILTRTNDVKAIDGVEPDFDGIQVMGYDKYKQEHYMAYRNFDLWGRLPLKVEGDGDNKSFTVNIRNANGEIEAKRFVVFKDKNIIKVKPPENLGNSEKK